ncbi:protein FAR1-RELATED SEQUENCE 5-like [Ziziphus jujuba]|uniref:Protein FAR1-RELATED SEQUENCE n=1 Tax=Ziziphus jujuba TaxID=326968 RepID=A0ABM4AAZ6_ZIZJJ|nr:protein FAR1-RELATED SEQUENCE 5-like [Ziziphus jujuba]
MQVENSDFFYAMDLDDESRIKNLFLADARSRAECKEFGDVVTFDTTYLTNKYDMPFVSFVGVNHHGQSTLFGYGLISNEDTEIFKWLFQCWLSCMYNHTPNAIITDQDKAMQNAIKMVFPHARHRWCLWHIMKKVPEKLKSYKQYVSIKFALHNIIYDSLLQIELEDSWSRFIAMYSLQANDWLSGLYNERQRWVPAFVKDTFWAGMSTTQRCESMDAFFDGHMNSNTSVKQFVEQYDNALRDKVEKENHEDFISFNSWIPCISRYDIEKQYQSVYTTAKFNEFQQELVRKNYCELSSNKKVAVNSCELVVDEDVMIGQSSQYIFFIVHFNEEKSKVTCNC